MSRLLTLPWLLLSSSWACADAAADFGVLAAIDANLQRTFKADARVASASLGLSMDLKLWDGEPQPLEVRFSTNSSYLEQRRTPFFDRQCTQSGTPLAEFRLAHGYRAWRQAQMIADELQAAQPPIDQMRFGTSGDGCASTWRLSMVAPAGRYLEMHFADDGRLRGIRDASADQPFLDAAALQKLDTRTRMAEIGPRVEADPSMPTETPVMAESEPVPAPGAEFLTARLGATTFVCVDGISLNYDYDRVDLECELAGTAQKLGFFVRGVPPGPSVHSDAGIEVFWRDGLQQYESTGEATVRFSELSTTLISGSVDARLESPYGPPIRLEGAQFRLLPSPDFRVTPPVEAEP